MARNSLICSCKKNGEATTIKLIDSGVDLSVKNDDGSTFIDYVHKNGLNKVLVHVRHKYQISILENISAGTIIGSSFNQSIADLNVVNIIVNFI